MASPPLTRRSRGRIGSKRILIQFRVQDECIGREGIKLSPCTSDGHIGPWQPCCSPGRDARQHSSRSRYPCLSAWPHERSGGDVWNARIEEAGGRTLWQRVMTSAGARGPARSWARRNRAHPTGSSRSPRLVPLAPPPINSEGHIGPHKGRSLSPRHLKRTTV